MISWIIFAYIVYVCLLQIIIQIGSSNCSSTQKKETPKIVDLQSYFLQTEKSGKERLVWLLAEWKKMKD